MNKNCEYTKNEIQKFKIYMSINEGKLYFKVQEEAKNEIILHYFHENFELKTIQGKHSFFENFKSIEEIFNSLSNFLDNNKYLVEEIQNKKLNISFQIDPKLEESKIIFELKRAGLENDELIGTLIKNVFSLTKQVNNLKEKNEILEVTVDILKSKNEELEKGIEKLKSKVEKIEEDNQKECEKNKYKFELINKIEPLDLFDSKILRAEHIRHILLWTNKTINDFKLLWSATKHGDRADTFHYLCDNKGATITIIEAIDGRIFGWYISQSWESTESGNKNDPLSFTFDLNRLEKFSPSHKDGREMVNWNKNHCARLCCLYVNDKCLSQESYIISPCSSAENPKGNKNFIVKEIEVYKVNEK